jgi:molecular chaperone IbpA
MNNQHQVSRMDALSRALIGFDQMFDQMERRYSNSVSNNYPPHNILKTGENQYEIQIAVTGFEKDEIAVTVESNVLTVKGEGSESVRHEQPEIVYLHRGLATRDFVKEFPLAEHIEVVGAETKNGMLIVKLIRNIPESAKPKVIDIVEVK